MQYQDKSQSELIAELQARDLKLESTRKALKESEDKYHAVFNAQNEGIVLQLSDGSIHTCNQSAERILGLTAEQMMGRTSMDPRWHSVHEDGSDFPGEAHPMMHTLRTGEATANVIMGIHNPDGQLRWISINCNPLFHEGENQPYAALGSFTDITEQKITESHLKTSNAYLDQILLNLPIGVAIYEGPDYRYFKINKTLAQMHELPVEAHLGKRLVDVLPSAKDKVIPELDRVMATGRPVSAREYDVISAASDQPQQLVTWKSPIFDEEDNVKAIVSLVLDISKTRQLEQQLRQAQKHESMGVMASGMAHEFNNLLSPIMGFTELLLDEPEFKSDSRLKSIYNAAENAKSLVAQILTFGRKSTFEPEAISIEDVLEEALTLLQQTLPASISISKELEVELPKVLASHHEIHQIIINLCINAHQAMPDGGKLNIRLHKVESENLIKTDGKKITGPFIELQIEDSGCGIPESKLQSIFEPFYTTKGVGKGTGLGLSVALGVVEQHNGNISVESKEGVGSKFSICLPAIYEDTNTPTLNTASSEKKEKKGKKGKKGHIMLVDDESMLIELSNQMLEKTGYSVTSFTDPENALKWFSENSSSVDVVITDFTMPKLTGTQLAKELKDIRKDIPIILSTGYNDSSRGGVGPNSNISALLKKPYLMNDVNRVVGDTLDAARSNTNPSET